jgi:hypothetical protein
MLLRAQLLLLLGLLFGALLVHLLRALLIFLLLFLLRLLLGTLLLLFLRRRRFLRAVLDAVRTIWIGIAIRTVQRNDNDARTRSRMGHRKSQNQAEGKHSRINKFHSVFP